MNTETVTKLIKGICQISNHIKPWTIRRYISISKQESRVGITSMNTETVNVKPHQMLGSQEIYKNLELH